MKKLFTLLSVGALVAGTAFAAPQVPSVKSSLRANKTVKKEFLKQSPKHVATATRGETRAQEVIYDVQGDPVYYSIDVTGMMYGEPFEGEGYYTILIYGEDDTVYFYDIMPDSGFGTYTVGTISEDAITVELPQLMYYYEDYGYGYLLTLLKLDKNGEYQAYEGNANFLVYDDGDIVLELPEGDEDEYMLGLVYTDDYSDAGLGYTSLVFSPLDEQPNTMPEGLETETYYFNDGIYGLPMQIAVDNNKLYLEGLCSDMAPYTVIVADLEGNKATISQDQFLGFYYMYYPVYTKCVIEEDGEYVLADASAVCTLELDWENNYITYAEDSPLLFIMATTEEGPFDIVLYENFVIQNQDNFSGTPKNPRNLLFTDENLDYYGYYSFFFTVPNVSTEGNVLNNEDLYYKVYVDGDLFTFEEDYDNYYYFGFGKGDEVPFNFTNGDDFYIYSGGMREVGFYFDTMKTLGVQTVYKYDNNLTQSDIVTLNLATGEITEEPAGIESIFDSEIKSVSYYDLSGRKIANPEKGIYIIRATKADGSVVAKKAIIR
ncbi:MAG: hypothetical protein J1F12_02445 [Muribaculaceae bacterium]|nr:hypothetical protein [Muribaculaceae bacterium]